MAQKYVLCCSPIQRLASLPLSISGHVFSANLWFDMVALCLLNLNGLQVELGEQTNYICSLESARMVMANLAECSMGLYPANRDWPEL